MNLKRFKKGGDANSDELLKWIEEGCFDALSKKYLKSAILTILADTTSPNNVLETYTLRVNYPDSLLHQSIDTATANIAQLSLTRNDQSVLAVESSPSNFKEAMSKILKSLCVMTQPLKKLPAKKYLSMKLSYYEEMTPMGYEPPGFVAAEFDIDHLFQGPTLKYSFGKAATPYHNIELSMETINNNSVRPSYKEASINSQALVFPTESVNVAAGKTIATHTHSPTECQNNTIDVQEGMNFNESIMIASQVAQASNSVCPGIAKPADSPVKKTSTSITNITDLTETQQQVQLIKCTCGHNFKDLEMLQCETCMKWQHSVCAGYVSCRDRRLENTLYICYMCKYGQQAQTLHFVQKLSQFRKALAVISAEGFESITKFSKRLGVSQHTGKNIRNRLVEEKFLICNGPTNYAIAKKDDYIKEKIKFYFNQNLTIHSDFVKAQERDGSSYKRKSSSSEEEGEEAKFVDTKVAESKTVDTKADDTKMAMADSIVTKPAVPDTVVTTKNPNVPIEINTMPFEVPDTATSTSILPAAPMSNPKAKPPALKTPPESTLKKKRKISIPSSRISCYYSTES